MSFLHFNDFRNGRAMTAIPPMMQAIEITEPGGPDVLQAVTLAVPTPQAAQVLIAVEAAGVNRPDVLQRMGGYPPPPGAPQTPGLEIAGRIVAVGPDVDENRLGEAVCALVAGGGYAEYCIAESDHTLPLPKGFSMSQAAALPETFFTVWHNVFQRGVLKEGETLLVHGGSSGIGTTAIQLAHALGSIVFATAGNAEKCAACERLGAKRAINYRDEDFLAVIKEQTGGKGVDLILDMVGGDYLDRNIQAAAMEGRIVQIAFLQGAKVRANFLPVMLKRLTITGSTLRARDRSFKADLAEELQGKVWPLLESGAVAPVMHASFSLGDAAKAHAMMEESQHIGKIVLTI